MKRVLQDEYKSAMLNMSNADIEGTLDRITMMAQQSLEVAPVETKHWTAVDERISEIADSSADTSAVSKSQVDSGVGGGTNPWTVASSDVGKFRRYTSSSSAATGEWATFTGLADPRRQEFKYYTASGWVDIAGYLPAIAGSADNDKLLMDINGTATWTAVNEVGTSFDDSPSNKPGKVYSIVTHSGSRKSSVRSYNALSEILPNKEGQRLTPLETALSASEYVERNELELGRIFKITTHTVTCAKRSGASHYNGMSTTNGDATYDHPVYLGTFDNMTADANAVVFLCPHLHEIPDDESANGHTATRWWYGAHRNSTASAENKEWSNSGVQNIRDFSFIMNVVSIDASTVTFTAASTLHETSFMNPQYNNDWPGNPPAATTLLQRFMKHPDSLNITFNVLWYKQES
tara:strand:+ start:500 stop:1717 length:1218 start_codon:yes stop_codon:yes gene_type:complete